VKTRVHIFPKDDHRWIKPKRRNRGCRARVFSEAAFSVAAADLFDVSVTMMILRGVALPKENCNAACDRIGIERMTPAKAPNGLSRLVYHDPSSLLESREGAATFTWAAPKMLKCANTARHEMVRLEGVSLS